MNNRVLSEKRMELLLQILHDSNNVSANIADKAKVQLMKLCSKAADTLRARFAEFSNGEGRLDIFYSELLENDKDTRELWTVVKQVLILSHGNASVESEFSINSSILVENMHEDSVVVQRLVYDAIQSVGGILQVDINQSIQQFARSARSCYEDALKKRREKSSLEDKRKQEKKRAADVIQTLKSKKAKLASAAAAEARAIDGEIVELVKLVRP